MGNTKATAHGYVLVEILVVFTIVIILYGLISFSLHSSQQKISIQSTINTFVTDLRQQQLKAMSADTEGRGTIDSYGIHLAQNQYTLFHGTTFNPNDVANFTVSMPNNIQFTTILFPGSNIIFTKGSGEINGFVNGQNTLMLQSTVTAESKTITINRYGIVTQVN